jgi:hypothetical protein
MKNNKQQKETMKDYTIPMAELADKAMKSYEDALRTGVKMQEEAGKWWASICDRNALSNDWQKQFKNVTGMASNLVPLAQRRMEDVISLMEKNGKTGAELFKKAVDAAQTPVLAESQAKWMDFLTSSMGAVRSNAEAVSEMSTKAIDSWIEFVRKNTDVTEVRVPKSA